MGGKGGKWQDKQNRCSRILNLIALTYVLVDDKDATFARIVGKVCDKGKWQP